LEQDAELNQDSALALLWAARDADLSNLATHLEYIARKTNWTSDGLPTLREEYGQLPDTPTVQCLRTYLETSPEVLHALAPALLEMEEEGEGEGCPTVLLAMALGDMVPHRIWEPRRIEYFRRAIALHPGVGNLYAQYAATLAGLGRYEEAAEVLKDAALLLEHPTQRVPLNMRRAGMLFLSGDTAAAVELRRAVAAAVERDGRPGVRLHYLRERDTPLGTWEYRGEGRPETNLIRLADFAREHGAWNFEWQARFSLGMRLAGWGEPEQAVEAFSRAIALADSVDVPGLRTRSYYKRGRVLGDLGRRAEAEADLRLAVAISYQTASQYYVADAWNNLVSMYFDAGRLEEALEASERFLEEAEPLRHSPLRWAAHLMAGEVRWKLGWHASANEAFERAISVIDEFEEYHNYAGEFFERQGDLARAREYYRRGVEAFGGGAESVRAQNWAGLARIFLELGEPDSALAAARSHDAEIRWERGVPLLPLVLAEQGRLREAVKSSEEWAQGRLTSDAIAGASLAHLQWAELALRAEEPGAALAAARAADSLAHIMDLVDQSIQATHLRGLALAALGDTAEAVEVLREAADRASVGGSADLRRSSHLALGEVLAVQGRIDDALSAFEEAAAQVLETTSWFSADFDRVRYRDRHLPPFDGAVVALLRAPDARTRFAELAVWSQRRKAAALQLAVVGTDGRNRGIAPLPIREVRARLRPEDAVVDFHDIDGSIWAMVVRSDSLFLKKLPVTSQNLEEQSQILTGPLSQVYGGRVDLARAPFNEELSHEMYHSLWLPLLEGLHGVNRVFLVPDGELHRVPMAALVSELPAPGTGNGSSGGQRTRFLLDEYELVYLPSISFLPRPDSARTFGPDDTRVLAVAGAAPGVEDEVRAIGEVWGSDRVQVLSGQEASESEILSSSGDVQILHLASHAVADDRDPLASHLQLSPDSDSDGLFHPVEIAGMPAGLRLVVLSACETQAGKAFSGEGLMGLSRAFLGTGAQTVIASQWLVGSEASRLMEAFHRHLASGASGPAALRAAQLATRARSETSHPFFWAGFVIHVGGG
jgi:CHAT domain-containing protein/Tfp pilus assembly protein PilF